VSSFNAIATRSRPHATLTLIDSFAWIDLFHNKGVLTAKFDALLESGDVALCGPIVTELRRVLHKDRDWLQVLPLLSGCYMLPRPPHLWEEETLNFVPVDFPEMLKRWERWDRCC
jgi:hypothetical protein